MKKRNVMYFKLWYVLLGIGCSLYFTQQLAAAISLGSLENFAVLAGSTVTNTGSTTVNGDVGVSPGTSVTGFPPGLILNGALQSNNAAASMAQTQALAIYTSLGGMAVTQDLTGVDLGGQTLTPGVYGFASAAQLTGILTLDGLGMIDPVFVFKVGSTLISATDSSIILINGARGPTDVFFQVGGSTTLGVGTAFAGTIIASSSNTLNTGASINGRVVALNGAVTLDGNSITAVPEPSSAMISIVAVTVLLLRTKRKLS